MKTKIIGVKEFRANIAGIVARARVDKAVYVVANRTKPLFQIVPYSKNETLDSLVSDLAIATAEIAAGKSLTQAQIEKRYR
jgi:prevent-host-death family protein